MNQEQCEVCASLRPSHDMVNYGSIEAGYRKLCTRCFNAEVARRSGLEGFENTWFEPVVLQDADGEPHEFHFKSRLSGDEVFMAAFEIWDGVRGGYEFEIIGDALADQLELRGTLIERVRRRIASKDIRIDPHHGPQIAGEMIRGRISSDIEQPERTPLLIIDGQEFSWEAFGRMLMTFEGWQFRLEILDRTDEV